MNEAHPPLPAAGGLSPVSKGEVVKDVTQLLAAAGADDATVRNELFKAVYGELRAIAARKMASERAGHTLQPTALVHEAWLKFANRAHFFAAAAEAMRHILVDSARRRSQLKRGGDYERVELFEDAIAAPLQDEKLLMVNEALDTLAREDPLKAEVVKLRYFVGLSHQEIADALEVNESAIQGTTNAATASETAANSARPAATTIAPGRGGVFFRARPPSGRA